MSFPFLEMTMASLWVLLNSAVLSFSLNVDVSLKGGAYLLSFSL